MTEPYGQATDQYGQPEPFDPKALAPTPKRATRPSARRFMPAIVALAVAVVAFAGGFAVAHATTPSTTRGLNGFPQGGVPNASGRPRTGGFGGGASGTIGSVSAGQMTITTAAGGQRIVLLTPTTTVTQVTSAAKAITDLTAGATVTIVGTSNPDGSVTATQVVIGNVGLFGRGGGAPADSAAPSTAP